MWYSSLLVARIMSRMFNILLHIMAALLALLLTVGELLLIAYSYNIYMPPEPEDQSDILAITRATLINGTGAPPLENTTILISRDRIWRIEAETQPPPGAQVIDVAGRFALPALTDTALFFEAPVGEERGYMPGEWEWDITRALPTHRRALLDAGVTTVQDIGGELDSSIRRRSLIQRQELAGPRLFISGPILRGPLSFPGQEEFPFRPEEVTAVVVSTQQARQWVQQLAAANVDLVSVSYTSLGEERPRLPTEILSAIIEEAHTYGRRVIVYTAALEETREAVSAGADAVVGGVTLAGQQIDGDLLRLMTEQGTVYIPALAAVEARQAAGPGHESLETAQNNARLAYQAGITVVAGSATMGQNMAFGSSLHTELALLAAAGLTPEEAIRCATGDAARFLRAESVLGTVKEGGLADLVILDANPLDDIRALDQIRLVVHNGAIVVNELDGP
jgi:imidazolonepropionase-like amidohydrolase